MVVLSVPATIRKQVQLSFFELPLKQKTEEIICQPKAYLNELIGDNDNEQIPDEDNFDTTLTVFW